MTCINVGELVKIVTDEHCPYCGCYRRCKGELHEGRILGIPEFVKDMDSAAKYLEKNRT